MQIDESIKGHGNDCVTACPDPCANCDARRVSICRDVPDEDIGKLATSLDALAVGASHTFLNEGDPATHVFNVTGGVVKLFRLLPDGRRQVLGFLYQGDFIGLSFQDVYAVSAEAVTPVTLCRFRRRRMTELLEELPELRRRMLGLASNELASAYDQMVLLGRKTAQERLASFLVSLSERAERLGRMPYSVQLPMSRFDIADYLGLTVETVSRTLRKLKLERVISVKDIHVVNLLDPARLRLIASGGAG